MRRLARSALRQKAVYWPALGTFDSNGDSELGDPIEIRVRWIELTAESNDPVNSTEAKPVQITVDRKLIVGSQLWLGALACLPEEPEATHRVVNSNVTPDHKARRSYYTAELQRN